MAVRSMLFSGKKTSANACALSGPVVYHGPSFTVAVAASKLPPATAHPIKDSIAALPSVNFRFFIRVFSVETRTRHDVLRDRSFICAIYGLNPEIVSFVWMFSDTVEGGKRETAITKLLS